MGSKTKWVISVITVLALAFMSVSDGADARRRCRRNRARCRPRPVQPVPPAPPAPDNLLVLNGGGFDIADRGRPTSTVNVDLRGRSVVDVDVRLRGLTHDATDQVDALLVGPEGRASILMTDAGAGSSLSGATFTFDDEAPAVLPASGAATSGTYRPSRFGPYGAVVPQPPTGLRGFDGLAQRGDWTLAITDDTFGGIGSLAGWTLQIELGDASQPPVDPPVVPVPPVDPPPDGGQTFRFEGEGPLTIIDDDVIAAAVDVPQSFSGRVIADVNVTFFGLKHTAIQDLDIKLENPSQIREVVLMSDVGSGPVDDVTFKLDDESNAFLPTSGPVVNRGIYKPRNVDTGDAFGSPALLEEFDGSDPAGRWVMTILDDEANDVGSLRGWLLEITLR
jgi:subtilisin-like proprotein convertase family protein